MSTATRVARSPEKSATPNLLGAHASTPTTRDRAPTFTGAACVARLASIGTAAIYSMHEASSPSSARTRAPAYHLHTAVRCAPHASSRCLAAASDAGIAARREPTRPR